MHWERRDFPIVHYLWVAVQTAYGTASLRYSYYPSKSWTLIANVYGSA